MLKAERAKKAPGVATKRKALQIAAPAVESSDDDDPPNAAASVQTATPAACDVQSMFAQFMAAMAGQPSPSDPTQTQAAKKPISSAKDLEKARVSAEKEAAKQTKQAELAQKKEAVKATKAAENVLALAAKALASLGSLNAELSQVSIPDDTPEILANAVKDSKRNISEMLKASSAVIQASKKKDFVMNGPRLNFDVKTLTDGMKEARAVVKKLNEFAKLMCS